MAINPELTDTVTVPNLPSADLALSNFFAHSSPTGTLSKAAFSALVDFLVPIIGNLGSTGYVPVSGNVLPNPIVDTVQYSIIGSGTFTWTGGSLVTTETLNVVSSNGTTWSLAAEIPIDPSGFIQAEDTPDGSFYIKDAADKIPFFVRSDGTTFISKFSHFTEERIKTIVGLQSPIFGKKISILGDSISLPDGAVGVPVNSTYIGLLETEQDCVIYRNAVGTSCIMSGGSAHVDFTDDTRWTTMTTNNPDIIIFEGGVNDFLQDLPIGSSTDTSKTLSFYGALDFLYRNVMAASPNARVFHMLPMHNRFVQVGGLIPEFNGVHYLTEYINAIKVVATRYGVGIIDTFQNSGITAFNIGSLSTDQLHPTAAGHKLMYNTIINELSILL